MKSARAYGRPKPTKQWGQRLLIRTRWSDLNQRVQLLKQSAQFIDENYTRGIIASDIHTHLCLHARKVNEIFQRFYGISASTYLRQYKCKVLFVQIKADAATTIEDHCNKAGLTGTPTEKREFKALFGMSVEEHWNQSKLGSFGNGEWEALHQTLPDARTEAEAIIQTLITTENLMTTFKTPKKD